MSWFDATSFTSYAKTALASAQKSIDKVLDIDEGKADASQKTATKETSTQSSSTQKKPGLKRQTSNPQSKSNTSTNQDSSANDLLIDEGGEFWSSFLGGSSASAPNSSSSSADKTPKTSLSPKQKDLNVQHEKIDNQQEILEKRRRKKRENRTKEMNVVAKNENKSKVSCKEDYTKICDKEISGTAETVKSKSNNENEFEKFSKNSSQLQSPDLSSVSKEFNTPGDSIAKEGAEVSPITVEQNLSLITENNMEDKKKNSKSHDNTEGGDRRDLVCNSQKVEMVGEDYDVEDFNEVKHDDSQVGMALTSEQLATEDSSNIDNLSKNIESLLHVIPMATSTPYSGKERVSEGLTGDEHGESLCIKNNHDLVRKSLVVDRKPEREESVRKEPVEDECVDEKVVTGTMYRVEEILPDKEENLVKNSTDEMKKTKENNMKMSNVPEPTQSSTTTVLEDSNEDSLKFTGEFIDVQNFIEMDEKATDLPQLPLEIESVLAPENKSEWENSIQVQTLQKEVSGLNELVNARESKMVVLSKENIDLLETNAILRSQLEQLEGFHKEEDEEFEDMKEEFTVRISETENKFNETAKERDELKQELEETTNHLTAICERQKEELTTLLSEKNEQMGELLAEGEKLSKQELQSNTIIKKLRTKEKENDTLIKNQTLLLEEYENEVKRLTDILTTRDDSNSKQEDAIIKLNGYMKKQEEQLNKQTSELEDAHEKVRSMQVALDNAYKEMMSLQKQAASSDSSIQEAVLSAEMKAKDNLRITLEKTRREYGQDSELMALQISDLQASLNRSEKQAARREESLREENKDLQQRIQEAEDRNQELAASVSHATRPLLRQIENLQTTHNGQASTWELVEKNLTERLNEAQSRLLSTQEKERLASQTFSELNSRIARLESQVNSYRMERSRLEAELELERTKSGSLEDANSREVAKSDAMLKKYKKMVEDTNLDKAYLEQQQVVEKSRMETELKKVKAALESKDKLLSRQSSVSSVPPSSPSAYNDQDDGVTHSRKTSSGSNFADGIARGLLGGTTDLVERLQAQIRHKDGEMKQLQVEVTSLRQSRDSVMEELTKMTSELHGLEMSRDQLTLIKTKYDELQQRYNAVLQMYGEKEEEAEELRMDLQDVKSMYKQQLEQLFGSSR